MKKVILLSFCVLATAMSVQAALSLVVKPLSGEECCTALNNIGRVTYSGDSLCVYDATGTIVFGDLLSNMGHLRFSDEQGIPTMVENANGKPLLVVYPNPTQDVLHIKNATGNVHLYSASGQLMQVSTVQQNEAQINVSVYPAGVYILISGNNVFKITKK